VCLPVLLPLRFWASFQLCVVKSKNVSGEKVLLEKEGCENDLEAVNLDLVLLDQANLGQPAANLGALVAL